MRLVVILQLTILLALANGAPIVAKKLLRRRFDCPLDGGLTFVDGHPLLGASKTVRGVLAAALLASAGAPLIGLPVAFGALVGATSMAGDILSSFLKRRLNLPPSSQATGLDQIPESLLPLLACRTMLSLTILEIVVVVVILFVAEIVLSRILYQLRIRDRPY